MAFGKSKYEAGIVFISNPHAKENTLCLNGNVIGVEHGTISTPMNAAIPIASHAKPHGENGSAVAVASGTTTIETAVQVVALDVQVTK